MLINKPQIILALDLDNLKEARFFIERTLSIIKIFKVGPRLFIPYGPKIVKLIQSYNADVFLDLKLFDIPNTVEKAIKKTVDLGVKFLTLHILGGKDMLKKAKETSLLEAKEKKLKPPFLLGVTVLTSQKTNPLRVLKLAKLAKESGLDGVICSVKDLKFLKKYIKNKNFLFVTPGIRLEKIEGDDQKRIATLKEAKQLGADYVVIGRPILEAKNVNLVLEKIRSELI